MNVIKIKENNKGFATGFIIKNTFSIDENQYLLITAAHMFDYLQSKNLQQLPIVRFLFLNQGN